VQSYNYKILRGLSTFQSIIGFLSEQAKPFIIQALESRNKNYMRTVETVLKMLEHQQHFSTYFSDLEEQTMVIKSIAVDDYCKQYCINGESKKSIQANALKHQRKYCKLLGTDIMDFIKLCLLKRSDVLKSSYFHNNSELLDSMLDTWVLQDLIKVMSREDELFLAFSNYPYNSHKDKLVCQIVDDFTNLDTLQKTEQYLVHHKYTREIIKNSTFIYHAVINYTSNTTTNPLRSKNPRLFDVKSETLEFIIENVIADLIGQVELIAKNNDDVSSSVSITSVPYETNAYPHPSNDGSKNNPLSSVPLSNASNRNPLPIFSVSYSSNAASSSNTNPSIGLQRSLATSNESISRSPQSISSSNMQQNKSSASVTSSNAKSVGSSSTRHNKKRASLLSTIIDNEKVLSECKSLDSNPKKRKLFLNDEDDESNCLDVIKPDAIVVDLDYEPNDVELFEKHVNTLLQPALFQREEQANRIAFFIRSLVKKFNDSFGAENVYHALLHPLACSYGGENWKPKQSSYSDDIMDEVEDDKDDDYDMEVEKPIYTSHQLSTFLSAPLDSFNNDVISNQQSPLLCGASGTRTITTSSTHAVNMSLNVLTTNNSQSSTKIEDDAFAPKVRTILLLLLLQYMQRLIMSY